MGVRSLLNPVLGPERRQPDRVPTDTVFQLSEMDSSWMMRMMIMSWTMCFHDVLDADKLHDSLTELLNIGHWKKLCGRPRLTVSSQFPASTRLLLLNSDTCVEGWQN